MKKIFLTGSAGFIGFHLAKKLLEKKCKVFGFDSLTNYYDVNLKKDRNNILKKNVNYEFFQANLEDKNYLNEIIHEVDPEIIIHLAAQAGVRYSIENPESYINSNIVGTFNLLNIIKDLKIEHLLVASSSSVYGSNFNLPFREVDSTNYQVSLYASTKKSIESLAHSYSNNFNIPTTILRFFTVYGSWGRPDMAIFKFVSSILNKKTIEVYNKGEMYRDFTHISDVVKSISLLIPKIPIKNKMESTRDSLSNSAPYRIVNIGNSNKIKLNEFINTLEILLKIKAKIRYLPMFVGDVKETFSDCSLINDLVQFQPNTNIKEGLSEFIDWYKNYYEVN